MSIIDLFSMFWQIIQAILVLSSTYYYKICECNLFGKLDPWKGTISNSTKVRLNALNKIGNRPVSSNPNFKGRVPGVENVVFRAGRDTMPVVYKTDMEFLLVYVYLNEKKGGKRLAKAMSTMMFLTVELPTKPTNQFADHYDCK